MDERLSRRRDCLMAAAEQLFVEQGVERTALADVVKRAGGSLATLYKLFDGKAGLLEAVMRARFEHSGARMVELAATAHSPSEVLFRLAADLRHRSLDPTEVALSRVLIASSIDNAELARRLYGQTVLEARVQLEDLFARWRDEGHPLTAEPALLSGIFLSMFIYEVHSQAIGHGSISEGSDASLDSKVNFFCRAAGLG